MHLLYLSKTLAPAPEKWLNNDQKELNIRERKLLVMVVLLYRSQSDPGILPLLQNITGEIAGEKRDKSPIVPIYVTNY